MADWSKRFPILASKTYLCSHSLGAVPAATSAALAEYYDAWATRGIHAWEGPWWNAVLEFSSDIEKLLHAAKGTVAPMQNATRAMAAVASCFDYKGPRNRVVLTDLEFTTFYPFWRGQEREGAELVLVESDDGVTVPLGRIEAAIDERTLLVATCHGFFRSGAVQDIGGLGRAAHRKGALLLVDGYQTAGTVPVDVKKSDVDFYVGGSHKYLCGGAGAGYLYVRPDLVPTLRPRLTGWFGLENPFAYVKDIAGVTANEGVHRFLDGTPNVPALYSAREGIRAVLAETVDEIRRASLGMTRHAMKRADELGLEVRTPRKDNERTGMVCLQFPGSKEAAAALVRKDIVVDWRPDCGLRMSPHFYNSVADVDEAFEALADAAKPTPITRKAARGR